MNITEALDRLVSSKMIYPIIAKVTAVNDDDTIDVDPVDDGQPEIFNVRINPGIGATTGIRVIPRLDSMVIVLMLNKETGFMVLAEDAETIKIDADLIELNTGGNGEMVNYSALKTELEKTTALVTALKDSLTGFTPVPNDGGAALKTYAAAQIGAKAVGDYDKAAILDDKITH